jgi:hypothetical protein
VVAEGTAGTREIEERPVSTTMQDDAVSVWAGRRDALLHELQLHAVAATGNLAMPPLLMPLAMARMQHLLQVQLAESWMAVRT